MQIKSLVIAASIACAGMAAPAYADVNLVTNGDFANQASGWTLTRAASGSDILFPGNAAQFGAVGSLDDTLTQDLHTVAGQLYKVSFSAAFGVPGVGSDLFGSFGGQKFASFVNPAAATYSTFSYTVRATGSDTLLSFAGRNVPSWNYVTNVNVSAVPEPSTYALMGLGMLALMAYYRKRNSAM